MHASLPNLHEPNVALYQLNPAKGPLSVLLLCFFDLSNRELGGVGRSGGTHVTSKKCKLSASIRVRGRGLGGGLRVG